MVRKSCFFGLLALVAMLAPLRADVVKINAQNCADFARAFVASHPAVLSGGRSFANASDFGLAIKLAEAERPRFKKAALAAMVCAAGAALCTVYIAHNALDEGYASYLKGAYDAKVSSLTSGAFLPGQLHLTNFAKYILPYDVLRGAVFGGSSYGLLKLARWFNQTPLSRVVATSNPYSLCKDVLADPNVVNVLSEAQICELMTLLSKVK